jgi:uncharacterized protein with GYD domain
MPTFQISAKYTPEAHAAVRQAGHASRETAMTQMLNDFGGKLISVYWLSSPNQDFVGISELPSSDQMFAMISLAEATGAFVRIEGFELRTSAQADAAIAQHTTWKPPGQS